MKHKEFSVGDRIIAISSDYAGLKGKITEIKKGNDKETENIGDDIYCEFDIPGEPEKIKLLEEHFSCLYGKPKKICDLSLDMVILAPEMIRLVNVNE